MNEIPLDDRALELRRLRKEIQRALEHAAVRSEKVLGVFCVVAWAEPFQREGEETLQVFTAGREDSINEALASYLDAEGVDFAALAEFQEFDEE